MIELDGSQGEGGGQILRTSLALSLITGKPFRIHNIRAKRPKPGLMRQHLACVQAAVAVGAGAQAVNDAGLPMQVGETTLCFTPGPITAGEYEFAVGSAGSCMLVLQTVLWPLLLAKAPSALVLRGGTHNPMAPSASYLQQVFQSWSGHDGLWFEMELRRHGFYPAGGGEMAVRLVPPTAGIAPFNLMQRGNLIRAHAQCLHAGLPKGVAQRELVILKNALGWHDDQLHDRALRANEGPGNVLMVVLQYEHITELFTAHGEKGVSAEQVARNVLQEVRAYQASQAPVGPHLADQLLIPLALSALNGSYGGGHGGGYAGEPGAEYGQYWATELTEHTRTNAAVIEQFLPIRFGMQPEDGGFVVRIET
jgi:RNA 3'-terminal phosphate cyclase (ATP)